MSWMTALRAVELTDEEMKGRVCSCPETGNPDEYGDGSSLPCMEHTLEEITLKCSKCIYCIKRER